MNCEPQTVYLCIITWPDGVDVVLFPRPGKVPMATTEQMGQEDFTIAVRHCKEYAEELGLVGKAKAMDGTKIRLVKFQCLEVLAEHVHRA